MEKNQKPFANEQIAEEHQPVIVIETALDRLRRDVYRPDMEKFLLFTKTLRENDVYKQAKITHK
jgi:hypothetical protein